MSNLNTLYEKPLPANRKGPLYNSFPYPTKISPEAIAIFIACHTKVGDTVLDPFSGSGTTGLATLLCDKPTEEMKVTAKELGVKPIWGKRNAKLFELGTLGAFVSQVMCNPPPSKKFMESATNLISLAEKEIGDFYLAEDSDGTIGVLRYAIWSEILICPSCQKEASYWEQAVRRSPLKLQKEFNCLNCKHTDVIANLERKHEKVFDSILNEDHSRKKRIPVWIYGKTGKKNWSRKATPNDIQNLKSLNNKFPLCHVPNHQMDWGILHRKGYHSGITHVHHFYTDRNLRIFSWLWEKMKLQPTELQDALKLLLLSYNATHSSLMSRVVVKKKNVDFVTTGAQSGVLYISNLPVEKNILEGVKRKIKTFAEAFSLIENSESQVEVFNQSSTSLNLIPKSVDYVFTDPPFGGYIPYSEINQVNEAWLGKLTNNINEVIVNKSQEKSTVEYQNLMAEVFSEVYSALKSEGKVSLVFHSAKTEIWKALTTAYTQAGFNVLFSSILDKIQGSFKQVTSTVKVQGDPLLLLIKHSASKNLSKQSSIQDDQIILEEILNRFEANEKNSSELKPERLYSRYITACLEAKIPVSKNAKEFYQLLFKNEPSILN